ncbi:TetR family transcriptional regulator [Vibrio panuliri]|uniref:TetR family transcriptional regulator n=1 Tax=Vibrio panuliri TaxID=1381081 RepID=A0A1Q9HHM1_9VIBR|nr:TetR/AcrR family transcriptional regulator [Vibrio panuliri]OLQ89645.1 TetR family transcriptional regulator [Vibrio panuliri]
MKRKAGRPSSNTQARAKLIQASRELFTVMAYDKVSIRLLASKAGVDSALIRYYFGNKEGLFETMLRETLEPINQRMGELQRETSQGNLVGIMRTYYQEMSKTPEFPRLILQVMNMPESVPQRQLLEKVIADIAKPIQTVMFDKLLENKVIRTDLDPNLCRVSFISLMVFPFIAPTSMLAIHGVQLNDEFLAQLFEHNMMLLSQGMFTSPQAEP